MDQKMVGWPLPVCGALTRLVIDGVPDEHPDLRVVTDRLGGMLSFFGERILSL